MQQIYKMFEGFAPESKVWVYFADRNLNHTEKMWLEEQLHLFTEDWASHGTNLKAKGEIVNDFTVVLSVDTSVADSSGCSIDKSVRFMKDAGKELGIDFFNRLKVWIKDGEEYKRISYSQLPSYPNAVYLDGTIQELKTLQELFAKI